MNLRQITLNNSPQSQETKPNPDIEPKAIALLEKIVEQSQSLRLAENRIYVKTVVADILWSRDEKRARAIYEGVTTEFNSAFDDIDSTDDQYYQRAQWLVQLRSTIVDKLAPRDPELALSFLRATREAVKEANNQYYGKDAEAGLESRLASLIAAKDPKLALQLARENLKKGFQYELISVLQNLRSKDKESYNTLLKEVLAKLKGENLITNQYAANVAWNLLSILRSQKEEEEAYKELVMALTSAGTKALNRNANQNDIYASRNFISNLRSYIGDVEKYAPSQMQALKKRFTEVDESLDPGTKEMNALNELAQNGTIDNILEAAAKAPEEYRNQFYSQAVWKAMGQGDYQRAAQIAESDSVTPAQRKQLLVEISRQRIYQEISNGKIDEVRQLLPSIKNVQESVQLYVQLANNIYNKGEKEKALQILREAEGLIAAEPKNYNEMNAKLQLAIAYAQQNPDRSFVMLASFPPQLNELTEAASKLNGFENNYLKDDEWTIINVNGSISGAINGCQQLIAELSRKDFDRAVTLAESFQRDEIRLKGLLLIAQMTMSKNN